MDGRLALRRPYTFVVLSLLIAVLGIGAAIETPKDIFPYINIPVVTVVWNYAGLTPTEMSGRIVTICERALTTTVNDIEHTESRSYQGVAIVKVYFQPRCADCRGGGAGDGGCADDPENRPAGNLSAVHHQVRRVVGADSAVEHGRTGAERGRPL